MSLLSPLIAMVGSVPLVFILISLVVMFFVGHWILRPLQSEMQNVEAPKRFFVSDFLWLMLLLQVAWAAVRAGIPNDHDSFYFILGFGCVVALAIWSSGVSVLAKARVTQPLRRGVLLVFLLPMSLAAIMAPVFGAILFADLLHSRSAIARVNSAMISFASVAGWALFCVGLRWTLNWILGGRSEVKSSQHPPE